MKKTVFSIIGLLMGLISIAQEYTVNGNAFRESCRCYTLTPNSPTQKGSVWNNNRIDLSQSFDFTFQVFLGCTDNNGADGMAFVLQPISTTVGGNGGGMGFGLINPSVGVTLDTYQNSNPDSDPFYDHIAIQLNGDVSHNSSNTITPFTPISATSNNVEDCQNHSLRIVWNATTKLMSVFFDNQPRISATRDLVNTVFGGNPLVFWGFTAGTGALANLQRFCTPLTPSFYFLPTQKKCAGESIVFNDSTISFTGAQKYYWNFGDGSPIDSVNTSPTHVYANPGNYTVTLRVIGRDGCEEVATRPIQIGAKPLADFSFVENCNQNLVQFTDASTVAGSAINTWNWSLDNGSANSTIQNPSTSYPTQGIKTIRLVSTSALGCTSDTLVRQITLGVTASLASFNSVCSGAPAFTLSGGLPAPSASGTGTYFGPGVNSANSSFNPQTAGVGTHIISYVYSTPLGCKDTATSTILVTQSVNAAINGNNAVCLQDQNITLTGTPTGGVFSGNGISSTGVFNPTSAGVGTQNITYSVASDPCIVPATFAIVVNPNPTNISAGPSQAIFSGGGVTLQGVASNGTYTWSPPTGLSNTSILNPFANPTQTTIYTLTVENSFGCKSLDTMVVDVYAPCLDPAKIFTPNNDGLYDKWIAFNNSCVSSVEAFVYNRWGGQVYYSRNYQNNWDGTFKGKALPDATYYYVLNVTDITGKKFTTKGNVTIKR
jgi:gliding motility-associated-like protein